MIRWLAISRAGGQAPKAVRGPLRGLTQRAGRRSARQPEDDSSTLHKLTRGANAVITERADARQELVLRSRRAQTRCTQPRATLSSRKQSRRPHEYLTPLLTNECRSTVGPQGREPQHYVLTSVS